MRIVILLSSVFCALTVYSQEQTIHNANKLGNAVKDPKEVVARIIDEIDKIKNVDYVLEDRFTIPYLPEVFGEPFITRNLVSSNNADTIHGASFKISVLKDTFETMRVYDGRYYADVDSDTHKVNFFDLAKYPEGLPVMGPFYQRMEGILKNAISRKADIKIISGKDSLTLEIVFNNLQLEVMSKNRVFSKDTVGFLSRYILYVDPATYVPIKMVRAMPYQTTIQTILHQRINVGDPLTISAQQWMKSGHTVEDLMPSAPDSILEKRFNNTTVTNWKLKEVGGDSIQFSDLKNKKGIIMVFNSVGWRPCVQVIPFLKQLKTDYPEVELVSIEPFINNTEVLKEYKQKHEMNYSLLIADKAMKSHYSILQVPVFMFIDKQGVIKIIHTGFSGKETEALVRNAIEKL
jgi:hypothetical protein